MISRIRLCANKRTRRSRIPVEQNRLNRTNRARVNGAQMGTAEFQQQSRRGAGQDQQHLHAGGDPQDHFDNEQGAVRNRIDQHLAQVERRSHGRQEHGNHLPIKEAEQ